MPRVAPVAMMSVTIGPGVTTSTKLFRTKAVNSPTFMCGLPARSYEEASPQGWAQGSSEPVRRKRISRRPVSLKPAVR